MRDHGFGLIEAVCAAALTLVIVLGALTVFGDAFFLAGRAHRSSSTNLELQAALAMMVRDVMQTGQGVPRGGIPLPGGDDAVVVVRPAPPGVVLTFADDGMLSAVTPGGAQGPMLPTGPTDVITLVMSDARLPLSEWPLASVSTDGSRADIDPRTPNTGADAIGTGDLILFSNALGNALQMVTGVDAQTMSFAPGDPMRLNQPEALRGSIVELRPESGVYPPITATRMAMVSYYVDAVSVPSSPRLMRRHNLDAPMAVALDVTSLRVRYDLIDGATNPVGLQALVAPHHPHHIRLVAIELGGRVVGGDGPLFVPYERTVSARVGLRSLSYLDRYQ